MRLDCTVYLSACDVTISQSGLLKLLRQCNPNFDPIARKAHGIKADLHITEG
jgi:hypothetical protein